MKHLAGEPRQSTRLTTDECRDWPDSPPQKVNMKPTGRPLYSLACGDYNYVLIGFTVFSFNDIHAARPIYSLVC
jgi:hypothetical protein